MKKYSLILISITCLFAFNTKAETFNKLDSSISYSGDLKANAWNVSSIYTYKYHKSQNVDTLTQIVFYPNGKLKQKTIKPYTDFSFAKEEDNYSYSLTLNYDTLKNTWNNFMITNKTYDSNGQKLETIPQVWDTLTKAFVNSVSGYYTKQYSDKGLLIYDLNKSASAVGKPFDINNIQYKYHYNSKDLNDTTIQEKYNNTSKGWENQFKNIYKYDSLSNQIEWIQMSATTGSGSKPYANSKKYIYTYKGSQLIETTTYGWSATLGWQYANYYSKFTYDANGKKIKKEMKQTNTAKTKLVGYQIHEYTPDAKGNLIAYTKKDTLASLPYGFPISYRDSVITKYDKNGNLIFIDGYKIVKVKKTIKTTANKDSLVYVKDSLVIGSGFSEDGYSQNSKRTRYVWSIGGTGISDNSKLNKSNINLTLSPNPAIDYFKAEFKIEDSEQQVSIKMFDMSGKLLKTFSDEKLYAGEYSQEYKLDNIASGIYLIRIKIGDSINIKKLVVK